MKLKEILVGGVLAFAGCDGVIGEALRGKFRDYSEFRMTELNKTHSSFKCGYCHSNYEGGDKKYSLSERKKEIKGDKKDEINEVKKAETTSSRGLFSERIDENYIREQVNDALDRAGLLNPIQKKINKTIKILNEKDINKKARLIYENLNDLVERKIIFNGNEYSINERRCKEK